MSGFEVIEDKENIDLIDLRGDGSGKREITGLGGDDIITGGDGINIIYGDGKYPLDAKGRLEEAAYKKIEALYKRSEGNDIIKGGTGVNIIHAGLMDDEITGGAGVNLIQFKSGDGCDTIYNSVGEDYLYFCDWSFDNAYFSKQGNDLVITYRGTETIPLELKPDMGKVTLKDYFKYGEKSSIKGIGFNSGLSAMYGADVSTIADMIEYDDFLTTEKLAGAIKNAFKNSSNISGILTKAGLNIEMEAPGTVAGLEGNDTIKGSAGCDIISGGGGDDTITGGAGDDKLYGGSGENTFIFRPNDGKDTIYYQNGIDILNLTNAQNTSGATKIFSFKEKNDLIIKYNISENGESEDEIRLYNYFKSKGKSDIKLKVIKEDNDGNLNETKKDLKDFIYVENNFSGEKRGKSITGTFLNDNIQGSAQNDTIKGGEGNDIISGNKGNDRLYGEGGKNTFVFKKGDGNDTVYSGKGEDTIKFEDIEAIETNGTKNVKFSAKGNNLIINYGNNDCITIPSYLKNPDRSSVKYIQFKNAKPVTISSLLDTYPFEFDGIQNKRNSLKGTNSVDIMRGANLNDTINALGGDDTVFAGGGNDLVRGGNGNDVIYGEDGNDKLYGDNGDDTLYGGYGNDIIYGGAGNDIIFGGKGDDRLYGVSGNNTFHFEKGDGQDIVYIGKGSDTLAFDDTDFSGLTYSLGKSNALKINYENGDSVDIASYFARKGKVSVKKIKTTEGEKTLDEIVNDKDFKVLINGVLNKKNTLRGTYKNDVIKGGNLNDTILGNDGDDIIYGGGGNDLVRGGNGNDVIYGEDGNDKIYGDMGDDIIFAGSGNDLVRGGNGDDIIYGGEGDDKLYGDIGNNTFYFKEGDGADTIYMNSKASDTIVFDTSLKDTLTFDKKGNSLVINYGTKGDSVTIVNCLKSKTPGVKNIVFADYDAKRGDFSKTEGMCLSDIVTKKEAVKFKLENGKLVNGEYYKGTEYNNLIISTGAYSEIDAGDGDDTIYLQSKNVYAKGGKGDDKYIVSSLNNKTMIEDSEGQNTIKVLTTKQNTKFLFDVQISENGEIINSGEDTDSLLIVSNAAFNRLKSGKLNITSGIEVDNFLNASNDLKNAPLKGVETNNGFMDINSLNSLRQEVAGWLSNSGGKYFSAMDVLDCGNKQDIQSLLKVYQGADTKWI